MIYFDNDFLINVFEYENKKTEELNIEYLAT